MKLIFLLFSFLIIFQIISYANTITSAEYFIDTDPGQGNGISLTGTFGGMTATASLSGVSTSGLSLGTHIVYVRFKDSNSNWGSPSAVFLNVGNPNSSTIVSAEYFIDTDPGEGNGISLTGTFGGMTATASLSGVSTSGLSFGTHIVYVRFKDSDNDWGEPSAIFLNVGNPNSGIIVSAEYYIDTDPGQGNGTSLTGSFGSSVVTASLSGISTSVLSFGTHIVYVRFKDSNNDWGEPSAIFLNVGNPNSGIIVSAEYFIDTDPGVGNGITLSGTFGGSTATAYLNEIPTAELDFGLHNIYVRFKDSNNNWSDVGSKTIFNSAGQHALDFDGVDDYVEVNNNPSLNFNGSFSVSLWFKPVEFNQYQRLVGQGFAPDGNISNWSITFEDNNSIAFFWESSDDEDHLINSNSIINDTLFHNIAVFVDVDLGEYGIYLDGNLKVLQNSDDIPASNINPLFIGVRHTQTSFDRYFNGILDELRIWNRALTEVEIQERMYRELDMNNPADTTGLVGYWDFNEGIGDIAHDKTQYANNGILINDPQWVDGFNFNPSMINIIASYIIDSQETVFDTLIIELKEPIGNLHFNEDQTLIMSGPVLLEGVAPDDYDFVNSRTFYIMFQLLNDQNVVGTFKSDNFEIPELPPYINHNFDITYQLEILTNDNNPADNEIVKEAKIWVADFEYGEDNYRFRNRRQSLKEIGSTIAHISWKYSTNHFIWPMTTISYFSDLLSANGHCYGMASTSINYKNHPDLIPCGKDYTYLLSEDDDNVWENIRSEFIDQCKYWISSNFKTLFHYENYSLEQLNNIKNKLSDNRLLIASYRKHGTVLHTMIKTENEYRLYEYNNSYNDLEKLKYTSDDRGSFIDENGTIKFLNPGPLFRFEEPDLELRSIHANMTKDNNSMIDSLIAMELDSLIFKNQNLIVYTENDTSILDTNYVAEITIESGEVESYDFGSYKAFYIDNSVQPNITIIGDNNGSFSIMGINTSTGDRNETTQFLFENITFPNDNSSAEIQSAFSPGNQICNIDYDNDGVYDEAIENSYNGNVPSANNFPPYLINDIPILNFRCNITQNSINLLNYIEDEFPALLNYSLDYDGSIFDASVVDSILTVSMLQNFDNIEIINLIVADSIYTTQIPVYVKFMDADFSALNIAGIAPFNVPFIDQSTGYCSLWSWNWGDGSDTTYTTFIDTVVHTYQIPGIYTVSLTIKDDNDSTDTETKVNYITVYADEPPAAPTEVNIEIISNDAVITWSPVDVSIYGNPVNIDAYLVYCCSAPDSLFGFHGYTVDTTYTHNGVAFFSDDMFYKVTAYVGDMPTLQKILAEYPDIKLGELDGLVKSKKNFFRIRE